MEQKEKGHCKRNMYRKEMGVIVLQCCKSCKYFPCTREECCLQEGKCEYGKSIKAIDSEVTYK